MTTTETTDRRKPLDDLGYGLDEPPPGAECGATMPSALAGLLADAVRPAAALAVTDALTEGRARLAFEIAAASALADPWDEAVRCDVDHLADLVMNADDLDDAARENAAEGLTAHGYGKQVTRWAVTALADAAAEAARAAVLTAGESMSMLDAAGRVSEMAVAAAQRAATKQHAS